MELKGEPATDFQLPEAGSRISSSTHTFEWFQLERDSFQIRRSAGNTIQPNDHLVALPVRDLCNAQVVVRNPTTGQSDTAAKKDAGPHFPGGNCDPSETTVDPYLNTGTRPKVESLTCESGNNNAGIDLGDGTYAAVGSPSQVVWRWQ